MYAHRNMEEKNRQGGQDKFCHTDELKLTEGWCCTIESIIESRNFDFSKESLEFLSDHRISKMEYQIG